MSCYQTLQISANSNERAIKRAYAGLIKQYRPETHPADFARIREAYEAALRDVKWRQQWAYEDDIAVQSSGPQEAVIQETILEESFENAAKIAEQPAADIQPAIETSVYLQATDLKSSDLKPLLETTLPDFEVALFTKTLTEDALSAYLADASVEAPIPEVQADVSSQIEYETQLENLTQRYFAKLNHYAETSDEVAAEALTEELISQLSSTTIDEKIALEDNLLSWYLNAESPLLLAFLWLNNTFGWTSNSVNIAQDYGDWHANRISRIHELAMMYENALNTGDIGLVDLSNQTHPLKNASKKWLITTEEAQVSSPLRQRWLDLCEFNGFEKLNSYFKTVEISRWQLVWADVIFGGLFAALAWLLSVEFSLITTIIIVLIWFVFMSYSRLASLYVMRKVSPVYARCKAWLYNKIPLLAWVDSGTKLAAVMIVYGIVFCVAYALTEIGFFLQLILVPIFAVTIGFVALIYLGLLIYIYKFAVGIEGLTFGFTKRLKSMPAYFKNLTKSIKSFRWLFIIMVVLCVTFIRYMQTSPYQSNAEIKPRSALELRNQALEDGKPPP